MQAPYDVAWGMVRVGDGEVVMLRRRRVPVDVEAAIVVDKGEVREGFGKAVSVTEGDVVAEIWGFLGVIVGSFFSEVDRGFDLNGEWRIGGK